ncbi:MAG: hypothetical protein ACQER3_22290 [Pseudomonadota bacterium]|uniref:Inner membrane protein yafU n=1 Tax=Serratia fonticola TaxID=47917 RepID=A0AAW3WV90_SERFO|nr:hypothetical protein [Serratia fonticola]MBC3214514.1 hypothetical protein [Serratia fonticola]MBC3253406.1 hypothetical protein [Serratia fonticola]NYA11321.1 hypothetical protein [Serratia fonticola]NYA31225.1 hypothetical protein [Serratia fonticola]PAA99205.1 hypothetical protein CJJ13_01290 [Serratia fonticola]
MRYDPVSQTFVEDDYRLQDHLDFKRQHADINYQKLHAQLNEMKDENMYALLTVEEAQYFLKTLCDPNANQSWKDAMFSCTDPMSSFAGNIAESLSVGRIAMELRGFGVTATEYVGRNGNRYIRLSGYPGIRRYLNATRYLIDNQRILDIGIGTRGIETGIVNGARFCIVFSAAYRAVELLLKDEYGLTDFFVNLTMDMAKLAVSIGATWWLKTTATAAMLTGSSVLIIAGGIFLFGVGIAFALFWLDNKYKISESIIKNMKSYKSHNSPYHADQFFNTWGRLSHG